jgi:hypothetical protein
LAFQYIVLPSRILQNPTKSYYFLA